MLSERPRMRRQTLYEAVLHICQEVLPPIWLKVRAVNVLRRVVNEGRRQIVFGQREQR